MRALQMHGWSRLSIAGGCMARRSADRRIGQLRLFTVCMNGPNRSSALRTEMPSRTQTSSRSSKAKPAEPVIESGQWNAGGCMARRSADRRIGQLRLFTACMNGPNRSSALRTGMPSRTQTNSRSSKATPAEPVIESGRRIASECTARRSADRRIGKLRHFTAHLHGPNRSSALRMGMRWRVQANSYSSNTTPVWVPRQRFANRIALRCQRT